MLHKWLKYCIIQCKLNEYDCVNKLESMNRQACSSHHQIVIWICFWLSVFDKLNQSTKSMEVWTIKCILPLKGRDESWNCVWLVWDFLYKLFQNIRWVVKRPNSNFLGDGFPNRLLLIALFLNIHYIGPQSNVCSTVNYSPSWPATAEESQKVLTEGKSVGWCTNSGFKLRSQHKILWNGCVATTRWSSVEKAKS